MNSKYPTCRSCIWFSCLLLKDDVIKVQMLKLVTIILHVLGLFHQFHFRWHTWKHRKFLVHEGGPAFEPLNPQHQASKLQNFLKEVDCSSKPYALWCGPDYHLTYISVQVRSFVCSLYSTFSFMAEPNGFAVSEKRWVQQINQSFLVAIVQLHSAMQLH